MFTLEYLPEGSDGCPLIRLDGFEAADAVSLQKLCIALAQRQLHEVSLEIQPWVRAIGQCSLTLRSGDVNRGINAYAARQSFVMEYNSEGWLEVSGKLEPFIDGCPGFQWLTNEGDVNLLISRSGRW